MTEEATIQQVASSSLNDDDNDDNDVDTAWGRAIERPPQPIAADAALETCSPSPSTAADSVVDVAIIGGGLVGLSVAIGLLRHGIDCLVYERAPQLRSVSQGILAVQPNGNRALEAIHPDIPHLLLPKYGCERNTYVSTKIDADGNTTEQVVDTGESTLKQHGRPKYGITWHNMQQLLASLLPKDAVKTGYSFSSFVETPDYVLLHFENGRTVRANAVIACDGIFSTARGQMFPTTNHEDSPIYFGQLNWASIIETNKLPPNVHPPNAVHYFMHEGEPTRWMSMLNDGGSGNTFWQLRVVDPEKALSLSKSRGGRGGLGLPGVKQALLPIVEKASPLLYQAINCIPEGQIFERSIVGRYPLPTWRSTSSSHTGSGGGLLVLVGDAAHGMHPNIAQGANAGFESAAALVEAMAAAAKAAAADSNPDWRAALELYETKRKPRADIVQRFSNLVGVQQATGKEYLSASVTREMIEWICKNNDDTPNSMDLLPAGVVDVLNTFDPCTEPGVSLLW